MKTARDYDLEFWINQCKKFKDSLDRCRIEKKYLEGTLQEVQGLAQKQRIEIASLKYQLSLEKSNVQ